MTQILETLASNSGPLLAILLGLTLTLVIFVAKLTVTLHRRERTLREMMNGMAGVNLEELLVEQSRARASMEKDLEAAVARIETLERKLQKSKRHVGIVRYDAFQDIGGLQSFALALYDDNGDGVVLSSIIGRAEGRVYGKPILAGKSDRNLTSEEQQAIVEAVSPTPKSILSGA